MSKDTSPYKTHAGAHFQLGGRNVHAPGFYLHLEPGGCFVAGGMWMPHGPELLKIRRRIADKPAAWERARGRLDDGYESLKRPPRGFDPDHPMIEDLKRKSFTASSRLTQKQVLGDDFMQTFTARCKEISPLLRFLADAVGVPW